VTGKRAVAVSRSFVRQRAEDSNEQYYLAPLLHGRQSFFFCRGYPLCYKGFGFTQQR